MQASPSLICAPARKFKLSRSIASHCLNTTPDGTTRELPQRVVGSLGQKSIWIFGYGSVIHNPGFDYANKVQGYIKGWRRVFWQGSTDNRGTPEYPGRTATLEEDENAVTWGVAYELAGDLKQQQESLQYMEWREKQYDLRATVDVLGPDGSILVKDCLCYVATPDLEKNEYYLGPASLEDLAVQIGTARGGFGPNYEYLFKLADSMRTMGVDDPELFELEAKVQEFLEKNSSSN